VDSETGQRQIALETLFDAVGVKAGQIPAIVVASNPALTAAALDAASRDVTPPLLVLTGDDAAVHADAWVADRSGWLALENAPAGHAVLAPVASLARDPMLPGRWRGAASGPLGRAPAALPPPTPQAGELARALTARAALVDTQRHEVDRLRAQLFEQRAWVAAEAERVRASQSWRLGHRLVRIARLFTLRRDRGTDGLQKIIERMNEPL
jgi:hypothetical protein